MSRKTKLFLFGIGACFIICVCGVLLVLTQRQPTEEFVYTITEVPHGQKPSNTTDTGSQKPKPYPTLDVFLEGYLPIIADASPEVQAVMKEFDPLFRTTNRDLEIENFLPTHEWLQKLLDRGIVIEDFSDYSGWLSTRYTFLHAHKDPESLAMTKKTLNLHADASWDEVIEAEIQTTDKLFTQANQAMDVDPLVYGGSLDSNGAFIPARLNTAYVQTEGSMSTIASGTGVPEWVPQELAHRHAGNSPEREIPKHIEIIFLDDNGQPASHEVARSRATLYQLEPYLIKGADTVNEPDTKSGSTDNTISDNVNNYESETADQAKRARPDPNMSIDELVDPTEINLDARLTPKLPTDIPIESDVEKGLNDVERILREPESEDDMRRLIQIDSDAANEKERRQHSPPSDDK